MKYFSKNNVTGYVIYGKLGPEIMEQLRRLHSRRTIIYLFVGGVFIVAICHRVAPTVVADHVMRSFGITGAAFGSFAAMYFYIYAAMQIPSGLLADKVGPRILITAGGLIAGAGSVILGFSDSLQTAFLSRFLIGLGSSVIFCSFVKLISEWFRTTEFATYSGGTTIAGGIGGILATSPFAVLVSQTGWKTSFIAIGLIHMTLAAACWMAVRNRPKDIGLPSISEFEIRENKAAGKTSRPGCAGDDPDGLGVMLRRIISNKYTWPAFFAMFGVYGSVWAFSGSVSIPYLMQVYGFSREFASNILLLLTLGFSLAGPVVGFVSDRVLQKRKLPYVVTSALLMAAWFVLFYWNGRMSALSLGITFFLLGVFGAGSVLTWSCSKEVNHPALAGISTGIVNTGGFLGISIFQPLFGYVLDMRWDGLVKNGAPVYSAECYQLVLAGYFAAALIGFLAALLIRETSAQNIYHRMQAEAGQAPSN